MKKILFLLLAAILTVSCKPGSGQSNKADNKPVLTVTIEPLRCFTEAIAGDRFTVVSMVPKGVSPETYDPTPAQLIELARSKAYFRIGYIGFEQTWMEKLTENAPHLRFFDMSEWVELIYDDSHNHAHTHTHPHAQAHNRQQAHTPEPSAQKKRHRHTGGVEPHIWNSTVNARIIARNVLHALIALDQSNKLEYIDRYKRLCERIERTDSLVRKTLSAPDADRAFLIYHPALSYFARDYGLRQIPIEAGGKEPSPAQLKALIDTCRNELVHVVFVQPEFDRRNAELIARQTGTRVVDINPLSYNWEAEMLKVAQSLASPSGSSPSADASKRP